MPRQENIPPFESASGSFALLKPQNLILLGVLLLGFTYLFSQLQLTGVGLVIALLVAGTYGYFFFTYPIVGFYTAIALNFLLIGMGRYVKDVPVGLILDAVLVLTYLSIFFRYFRERVDWSAANVDVTYLAIIWFGYSVFEIVNPEARSFAAWFSGRGVSMYMFLVIPLALLFINNIKKIDIFLYIWGIISVLATLKGIMQLKIGLDYAEQAWMNEGNYKTHLLFGQLRVFSFYSDAGQFGANQAYTGVVASIFAGAETVRKKKFFFLFVAAMAFYGMIISGTRGAMSVLLAGFMIFFVLRKNIKVLSIGIGFLALVFVFFKFTLIGQGNPQIRRMRTAFDPNDASLQVRLDNQRLLKNYLKSRPFGGGIGHGGVKAQKYLPNAFLSQIATDSWYVLIWVEQGIVGLTLHLLILFYVVIRGAYKVMFRIRSPELKLKIAALISGMMGIMVASYGNAVLGTMPTALLFYTSMAIISVSERFDTPEPARSTTTNETNKR